MKVEEIDEAVAKLPPDQLARFRRWFTAFEAGRTDHAQEFDAAATKLGRLAGRVCQFEKACEGTMTARHAYEVMHRDAGRGQLTVPSAVLIF